MRLGDCGIRTAAMVVLLNMVGACTTLPEPATPPGAAADKAEEAIAREERALLAQAYIDPLTRYLEQHREDSARLRSLERVRAERDRRCATIAASYAARDKTAATLERFEKGYRYSCPAAVDALAARVAAMPAGQPGADPARPDPSPSPAPAVLPPAAAAPIQATGARPQDNCYLLFAIKNYPDARAACLKPAELGDAKAQYMLAASARVLRRYPEAVAWTQRAAAQELPEALHHLGLLRYRGQGLAQDHRQALRQFELAGDRGLAEAQYMAGLMHYRGEGGKRDPARARQWLEQAAQQGHALAQFELGELYVRGEGVVAKPETAKKWLIAAAEQGVSDARYRVGTLYAEGKGIAPDYVQAYVWLSLAIADGKREALAPREQVARRLSAEQLSDARHRVRRTLEQAR